MKLSAALKGLFTRPFGALTAIEAAQAMDDGAVLIDVREIDEWTEGHAPTAVHIPLGELRTRIGELPADRWLITVCRSGARSSNAAAALAGAGLEVANLTGGMNAWANAGLPVVRTGPGPSRTTGQRC